MVQAVGRIDHEHADVRPLDGALGAERGVELDVLVHLCAATEAGGIDEVEHLPSCASAVSIASRVVPATGDTTRRSSPSSRLMIDDLPTFGRPTTATWIVSASSSTPRAAAPRRSCRGGRRCPCPRRPTRRTGRPVRAGRSRTARRSARGRRACSPPAAPGARCAAASRRSPRRSDAGPTCRPRRRARGRLPRARAPPAGGSPCPSTRPSRARVHPCPPARTGARSIRRRRNAGRAWCPPRSETMARRPPRCG